MSLKPDKIDTRMRGNIHEPIFENTEVCQAVLENTTNNLLFYTGFVSFGPGRAVYQSVYC